MAQPAAGWALPVCWVLVGAAVIIAIYQTVRLWRWNAGKGDFCHDCGGMVQERNGRYGPYVRCLACGANRALR